MPRKDQLSPQDFALDAADFFLSAARRAETAGFLSESKADLLKESLWYLLRKQIERFTLQDSSSVPVETAQSLLRSVHYTLGIRLKQSGAGQDPARMLAARPVQALFEEGQQVLQQRLARGSVSLGLLRKTAPALANQAFLDTIGQALPEFFIRYDLWFQAHETPCLIDYPLFEPVTGFSGLEYIERYIKTLGCENAFCRCFSPNATARLLSGYCPEPDRLLINVFEPLLLNALGLTMLGKDPLMLDIPAPEKRGLLNLLTPLSPPALEKKLAQAADTLCGRLGIPGKDAADYVRAASEKLSFQIGHQIKEGNPDLLFVSFPL